LEGFGVKGTLQEAKKIADRVSAPIKKKNDGSKNKKSSKNERVKDLQIEIVTDRPCESVSERATDGSSELMNEPPVDRPTELLNESDVNYNDPIFWINDNYAKILTFLIQRKDRIGNTPAIVKNTRVSTATVKRAVSKLEQLGFLRKDKKRYNKGKVRGFAYTIDENICKSFMKRRGNSLLSELSSDPLDGLSGDSSDEPLTDQASDCPIVPVYKKTAACEIENILSNHPELGYWRQKGLTAKQINQWMKTVGCGVENIVEFLCYCRFEMVDLKLEESKPIENVFNWFFRILEKAGGYPQPKGYKSHQEKQIELERQITEQHEREATEAEEIYRRKVKAKQDKQFWDMMNDPEGDLYKKCFESLNDFQKKRTTGKGFEISMRSFFDKFMEESK